jgi:hypothetical protein
MTAIEAREKMKDRNLAYVAKVLDIPYSRLRRWCLGNELSITLEQVRKLVEYLRK